MITLDDNFMTLEDSFSKTFPTWIIAFCPDTDSFFVTNQRYFFWEYDKEFETEEDGIKYFIDHLEEFLKVDIALMNKPLHSSHTDLFFNSIFLENTRKWYCL